MAVRSIVRRIENLERENAEQQRQINALQQQINALKVLVDKVTGDQFKNADPSHSHGVLLNNVPVPGEPDTYYQLHLQNDGWCFLIKIGLRNGQWIQLERRRVF